VGLEVRAALEVLAEQVVQAALAVLEAQLVLAEQVVLADLVAVAAAADLVDIPTVKVYQVRLVLVAAVELVFQTVQAA
jgi:hypothetical protein